MVRLQIKSTVKLSMPSKNQIKNMKTIMSLNRPKWSKLCIEAEGLLRSDWETDIKFYRGLIQANLSVIRSTTWHRFRRQAPYSNHKTSQISASIKLMLVWHLAQQGLSQKIGKSLQISLISNNLWPSKELFRTMLKSLTKW